ncbi:MAG: hypothetical protein JXA66_06715 [Oligoflexia bacterium]|nr:hypothetical protein [Oligoflexia bacterium]
MFFLITAFLFSVNSHAASKKENELSIIREFISKNKKSGNTEEQIKWAEELRKNGQTLEACKILVKAYLNVNNIEMAKLRGRQAIAEDPGWFTGYKFLAVIDFKNRDYKNAINNYEIYMENSARISPLDRFNYAELLWWNSPDSAAAAFLKYIDEYKKLGKKYRTANVYTLYWSYYRLGGTETAVKTVNEHLEKYPEDCTARQDLLGIYIENKNIDNANREYANIKKYNCGSSVIAEQKKKLDRLNSRSLKKDDITISAETAFKYTNGFYAAESDLGIEVPVKSPIYGGFAYRLNNLWGNYSENFHTLVFYARYRDSDTTSMTVGFKKYLNYNPECLPVFFNLEYALKDNMLFKMEIDNHNRLLLSKSVSEIKTEAKHTSVALLHRPKEYLKYDAEFRYAELFSAAGRASVFDLEGGILVKPVSASPLNIGLDLVASSMITGRRVMQDLFPAHLMSYILVWNYSLTQNPDSLGLVLNFEAGVGGDIPNRISFGRILNFSFSPEYRWNLSGSLSLSYGHYTELHLKTFPGVDRIMLNLSL